MLLALQLFVICSLEGENHIYILLSSHDDDIAEDFAAVNLKLNFHYNINSLIQPKLIAMPAVLNFCFCFTMSSQMCFGSSFADAGTIRYCMEKLLSSWDCNV